MIVIISVIAISLQRKREAEEIETQQALRPTTRSSLRLETTAQIDQISKTRAKLIEEEELCTRKKKM